MREFERSCGAMVRVDAAGGQRGWLGPLTAARQAAFTAWGRVPPTAMVLVSILSVQLGATAAKRLFGLTGPLGAVALRLLFTALITLLVWRPSLRIGRRAVPAVVGYGVAMAVMNTCLYQAIDRIPLGVAVTIEFLGPLTVALAGARRWRHAGWAVLAAAGVVLLTRGGGHLDWVGVLFALAAGVGWGCYILASAAVGSRTGGGSGMALGMAVAAVIAVPFGVVDAGPAVLDPLALTVGLVVAVLSSVLPYTLELEALRRMPARVFGVLMSVEPAVAALLGLLVLGQRLDGFQWLAVVCVVVASIGSTRDR